MKLGEGRGAGAGARASHKHSWTREVTQRRKSAAEKARTAAGGARARSRRQNGSYTRPPKIARTFSGRHGVGRCLRRAIVGSSPRCHMHAQETTQPGSLFCCALLFVCSGPRDVHQLAATPAVLLSLRADFQLHQKFRSPHSFLDVCEPRIFVVLEQARNASQTSLIAALAPTPRSELLDFVWQTRN